MRGHSIIRDLSTTLIQSQRDLNSRSCRFCVNSDNSTIILCFLGGPRAGSGNIYNIVGSPGKEKLRVAQYGWRA